MQRAVIYARYSTTNQRPRSIEDQIAYCKDFIEQKGEIDLVAVFSDRAISGKSHNREGLNDLLSFIEKKEVDYIVVESLDRLSRDPAQSHTLFDIFNHYKIEILSPNDGKVNKLLIGLKSAMDSIFIDETASRVMRSHREIAKEGRVPAGIAYGYRVKTDAVDAQGKRVNGEREVINEQAEVVRRIFDMYANGAGSKAIAQRLNMEGLPSPTGGYWVPSTILGSRVKFSGILFNEAYRGYLVWNKSKKAIHPVSRKRLQTIKEKKEWITTPMPHLRIVSNKLWNQVQERLLATNDSPSKPLAKREKSLSSSNKHLSGMIYCGVCGAKCQRANETRYICGSYRTNKVCRNARGVKEETLANTVFAELERWVSSTENFDIAFTDVFAIQKKNIEALNTDLEEIDKKIKGYELVIGNGVNILEISKGLKKLQQERCRILFQLDVSIPVIPSSNIVKKTLLENGIEGLKEDFWNNSFAQSWRATMSLLVEKVVTTPIPDTKRGMTIDVKIAPMEGWAEFYRRITASRAHH